jgi:transcriptional regulator with XRE-family HTH domain
MPTRERLFNLGRARGMWVARQLGDEVRHARLAAGLSQAAVAAAAGLSQPTISRIERATRPHPDLVVAATIARIVGLDFRIHCYPAGGQLRDAPHAALLARFLARLPAKVPRQLEAPIRVGDQRAWDVLLTIGRVRIGAIAETRIRDLQALTRREHLKQVDGGVDTLLLVVARTRNNVRALSEASELVAAAFPLGTRAVLSALSRGTAPRHNGVVLI